MNKNFAQLEFSSGLFFLYSKEEKQGYDKHTSTKGNVSYRKYYKEGISGILESASIFEGKFGNQLSLTIKNGEDIYYVPVDIADQKGNVDTYAESLIKFLPQLNKGDNITFKAYNFTPEGEKYAKIGVSITKDGEKMKALMTNAYTNKEGVEVKGDIPAIVWKKDALGKNKPSAVSLEAKNEYLLDVLKRETERLKWVAGSTPTVSEDKPKNSVPTATPQEAFDNKPESYDSLPF